MRFAKSQCEVRAFERSAQRMGQLSISLHTGEVPSFSAGLPGLLDGVQG